MGKYDDNSGKIVRADMLFNGSIERNPGRIMARGGVTDEQYASARAKIESEKAAVRATLALRVKAKPALARVMREKESLSGKVVGCKRWLD